MNITTHFAWREFACKDGADVPVKYRPRVSALCAELEVLRAELGDKPMTIVSGYRTPEHNEACGGAPRSQHMKARAADIRVKGVSADDVADTIERLITEGRMRDGGMGRYHTFTHYDISRARRWDER